MTRSQLSIAEEQQMHALQRRVNEGVALSDDEALELALLKRRFHLMDAEDDANDNGAPTQMSRTGASLTSSPSHASPPPHGIAPSSSDTNNGTVQLCGWMDGTCRNELDVAHGDASRRVGSSTEVNITNPHTHDNTNSDTNTNNNSSGSSHMASSKRSAYDDVERPSHSRYPCFSQEQRELRTWLSHTDGCSTASQPSYSDEAASVAASSSAHTASHSLRHSSSCTNFSTVSRTAPAPHDGSAADYRVAESIHKASKAVYFWSSLVATAVPGYLGKKTGLTSQFMHWNYIAPHLLLGAIPVVTQVGTSGNHLDQLRRQLDERGEQLGLVVACLEDDELNGFGVNLIQFAKEMDWRRHVNPALMYVRVPMEDTKATVAFEAVAAAVERLHECIALQRQTAYVHCKAGKGRSWMIVMCYLTTYGGLEHDVAARLVQEQRGQINPSLSQQCFAREFALRYAQRNGGTAALVRRRSNSPSRLSSASARVVSTRPNERPLAEVMK